MAAAIVGIDGEAACSLVGSAPKSEIEGDSEIPKSTTAQVTHPTTNPSVDTLLSSAIKGKPHETRESCSSCLVCCAYRRVGLGRSLHLALHIIQQADSVSKSLVTMIVALREVNGMCKTGSTSADEPSQCDDPRLGTDSDA